MTAGLEFHPVTPDRWDDLVALFGENGAHAGCWCMFNRLRAAEFQENQGDANREALHAIIDSGNVPGILAYDGDEPVGWCAVAPRSEYGRIQRSPVLKPVDDIPAWSINCFFVRRNRRNEGIASALLDAAVAYARSHGAPAVEGYPVIPRKDNVPPMYLWQGLVQMFAAAGFDVIARRKPARPIYRLDLQ